MGEQGHEFEVWEEIAAEGERIGPDVVIKYFTYGGQRAGLILYHHHQDGSVCGGGVTFKVPATEGGAGPRWDVVSWDPLELSPSIQDKTCSEGLHGHIVAGRWVPC